MGSFRAGHDGKLFTFIHIPKCAGSAIEKAVGGSKQKCAVKTAKGFKTAKHADIFELRDRYGDLGFTFTCVRNPWDRMVSAFHYYRKQNAPNRRKKDFPDKFEDYILNYDWGTIRKQQSEYFDEVDFLIRFETLEQDMIELGKRGIPTTKIARHNTSRHGPWRDYYTDETVEKVREHFKDDIERFGYGY